MPFNGSGVFNRTNGTFTGATLWALDKGAGTNIVTLNHDTHDQDLASGLTNCVTKDGQSTPTANLPMGGYIHTGVGAASSLTNYAQANQVIVGSLVYASTSGGSGNAYTASLGVAPAALADGLTFSFEANHTNTGASTVNLNSLGAVAITEPDGTALAGGEIVSGAKVTLQYDGSSNAFRLMSSHAIASVVTLTGTQTLTNKTMRGPNGSAGAPTYSFSSDTDTGIYTNGTGGILLASAGRQVANIFDNSGGAICDFSGNAGALLRLSTGTSTGGTVESGTGNLNLTAPAASTTVLTNGRITFPSTANPSSDVNTLDEYEEGTFTPAIAFGGAAVGVTYSARNGTYQKVGNTVHCWVYITLSNKGSSTGTLTFTGFPFTVSSASGLRCSFAVPITVNNAAGVAGVGGFFTGGATTANIYRTDSASGTVVQMTNSEVNNNSEWSFHASYVASN